MPLDEGWFQRQGLRGRGSIENTKNQQDTSVLYPDLLIEAMGSGRLLELKVRTERAAGIVPFMQRRVGFPGGNCLPFGTSSELLAPCSPAPRAGERAVFSVWQERGTRLTT